VLYYAPVIFGKLGLSSQSVSLLATGVVGIVMFIATIPAVMYVDRWGRKPTLIVGAIGMAICHFIIVSFPRSCSTHRYMEASLLIHVRPPSPPLSSPTGNTTRPADGLQS
jgi:MFS family permease